MRKVFVFNGIVILILMISTVYYISLYDDISGNLVRLHVISNSNSERDTKIKLLVRDNILNDVRKKINCNSKRTDILKALPEFEESANDFLEKSGIDYRARVIYEKADIPRKEYNGIVLPAGDYCAIKVLLGDGKGENWWCVAYPPLCFTESVMGGLSKDGEEMLRGAMDYNSYRMITSEVKYELKIVEIAKKVINMIK